MITGWFSPIPWLFQSAGRFLLTGSSSPEIVKGLSESLAGRLATIELWPFKAAEFYDRPLPPVYELLCDPGIDLNNLSTLQPSFEPGQVYEHWLLGGYPEPRIKGQKLPEFHGLWMDEYFADYIRRDIQRLFPRINTHTFRMFIQTLSFLQAVLSISPRSPGRWKSVHRPSGNTLRFCTTPLSGAT